jgi:hypothetical protein
VAHTVDLLVARGVLLDIGVAPRDVRLRLVVVVVGDEVLDRVLRKELLELAIELGREGLVVREHESRPAGLGDDLGHRHGLTGARDPEQDLVFLVTCEPRQERLGRALLVPGQRPGKFEAKTGRPAGPIEWNGQLVD